MSLSDYLVADRQCNECNVCCINLRIENPALTKKADVRCPYLSNQTGCSIYDQRPDVCRTWYCGWRVMPFLRDDMRPDRSKILIKQDETGFVFQPLRSENMNNLTHENVLEAIGSLVSNGIEVKTSIPTRPGYCNAMMNINEHIKVAVDNLDLQAARQVMRNVIFHSRHSQTLPEHD
ncbi:MULTISPECIES: YkgJ family cysteine cluster protein [Enterobacter]|uniref:YkgJ family cysteine cluster protein n=1 Tax=Enterobacter TaxID=547 RepID=UPI000F84A349|nr:MULTISPECIES: YkgJ family cysteine cluster protein [Enterobacter]MDV0596285.1 YkgJ family cysteine cluster protein [Enterobacter sp. 23-M-SZ-13]RTP44453.1 YkgJ family cysteine cluster protein [Enterobacter hormaechei]